MKKINFPDNKKFIFTIIDDTDDAFLENIKPVYDFLYEYGIFITKTVWVYPPRDEESKGHSLQHDGYRDFIIELKKKGYEIALHNIGSGEYLQEEILTGLEEYKKILGEYPRIHINHSYNPDSIYGGCKRFDFPFNHIIRLLHPVYARNFQGEVPDSPCFWGDVHKKIIQYNRNYETDDLNTLKFNPLMPYYDQSRGEYSNLWFSSTFAPNPWMFNRIVQPEAVDRLEEEGGVCVLYTHLGYYMKNGKIDQGFVDKIKYLSTKRNAWFAPVSTVLDFLRQQRKQDPEISAVKKFKYDLLYLFVRFKYRKIIKIDDYFFKQQH